MIVGIILYYFFFKERIPIFSISINFKFKLFFIFFLVVSGVCGGDGTSCCGGDGGEPCCKNYGGVSDAYWNYLLLPKTLDNILDQLRAARRLVGQVQQHLPAYSSLDSAQLAALNVGETAEFNRMYLQDAHRAFCEASSAFYTQLVLDAQN